MTCPTGPLSSDSVNLGSNPSSPATTNIGISGTSGISSQAERPEQREQNADTGRTKVGTAPVRIQRKRTKGWRMPEGAVYVGRPTKYGNPYSPRGNSRNVFAAVPPDAETAVRWYREAAAKLPASSFADIRGKNLACWCALDQPCHADVLLELANAHLPLSGGGRG